MMSWEIEIVEFFSGDIPDWVMLLLNQSSEFWKVFLGFCS
jgi:hypothetical protein